MDFLLHGSGAWGAPDILEDVLEDIASFILMLYLDCGGLDILKNILMDIRCTPCTRPIQQKIHVSRVPPPTHAPSLPVIPHSILTRPNLAPSGLHDTAASITPELCLLSSIFTCRSVYIKAFFSICSWGSTSWRNFQLDLGFENLCCQLWKEQTTSYTTFILS